MLCDSCGQPMDPDEPGLRRAIFTFTGEWIGQWQWHRDCPPAGPESELGDHSFDLIVTSSPFLALRKVFP